MAWKHPDLAYWFRLRDWTRDRAAGLCEFCEARPPHALHHRTYATWGCEPLEHVMYVCDPCHEYIEGLRVSVKIRPGSLAHVGDTGRRRLGIRIELSWDNLAWINHLANTAYRLPPPLRPGVATCAPAEDKILALEAIYPRFRDWIHPAARGPNWVMTWARVRILGHETWGEDRDQAPSLPPGAGP